MQIISPGYRLWETSQPDTYGAQLSWKVTEKNKDLTMELRLSFQGPENDITISVWVHLFRNKVVILKPPSSVVSRSLFFLICWCFPPAVLILTPCHFLSPWEPFITATHQFPHPDSSWSPSFYLSSLLVSHPVRLSPQPSSTGKISEYAHLWVINEVAGAGVSVRPPSLSTISKNLRNTEKNQNQI